MRIPSIMQEGISMAAQTTQNHNFDAMWVKHREDIRRFLLSMTRDFDLADDLLQNTYLRALEKHTSYHGGNQHAWLAAIARNIYYDHYRQRYVRSEIQMTEAIDAEGTVDEDHNDLIVIRNALALLKPAFRTALLMKHYAGYTYKEIACHQQCAVGTAKWRVSEALCRLRLALLAEGSTETMEVSSHGFNLVDYVYGILPTQKTEKIKKHLNECESCRKEVEDLQRVSTLLDRVEGDHRNMHFIEINEEGGATLYATFVTINDTGEPLTGFSFNSGSTPDCMYQEGEKAELKHVGKNKVGTSMLDSYYLTLPKPVQPGEFSSTLMVKMFKPGSIPSLGDGRFRFSWSQMPGPNYAYVQAIKLPKGAKLLASDPAPDETRGKVGATLLWQRTLGPGEAFKCTIEYVFSAE
ncbi:MAG: sigma-70 family RNA polymerase sigma factor [Armatimonadota bacterium]